MKTYYIVDYIA